MTTRELKVRKGVTRTSMPSSGTTFNESTHRTSRSHASRKLQETETISFLLAPLCEHGLCLVLKQMLGGGADL